MKISINEPCHENWDAMTPNQQGAFCHSCAKDVVDFSKKSLEEIKNFFSKPHTAKVCGRFEEKQLQELSFEDFFSRFTYWNFSKKFAVIFFMAFGFWIFSNSNAMAQFHDHMMTGEVAYVSDKTPKKEAVTKQPIQETQRSIKMGKVARETCTPETVNPETIKGNTVAEPTKIVEPTKVIEEKHMMMGMIAYKPERKKEPVVTKEPKYVKGDTVMNDDESVTKTVCTQEKNTVQIPDKIRTVTITEQGEPVTTVTPEINAVEITKTETTTNTSQEGILKDSESEKNPTSVLDNTKNITNTQPNETQKAIESEKSNSEAKIVIYPNPSNGNFHIETTTDAKHTISMYDENGKLVLIKSINGNGPLDASSLNSGVYDIIITGAPDEGIIKRKIVISK